MVVYVELNLVMYGSILCYYQNVCHLSNAFRYYSPQKGAKPLYGGNISELVQRHAKSDGEGSYTGLYNLQNYLFSYDGFGRLTESKYLVSNSLVDVVKYTEKDITYDSNGNVLSLRRFGTDEINPKDNFTYTYNGDKIAMLSGISDYNTALTSTNGNTTNNYVSFSYDANGNTVYDGLKNISLEYTQLNTLSKITTVNNTTQSRYSFFADGAKYEVRESLNKWNLLCKWL